jgi:hypothetical protein
MFAAARGDLPDLAGFAAGDSVAMLFFCEQTNAGEGISLDPQGSATGTAPQTTGKPAAKQNPVQSARPGDIACGPFYSAPLCVSDVLVDLKTSGPIQALSSG